MSLLSIDSTFTPIRTRRMTRLIGAGTQLAIHQLGMYSN